MNDLDDRDLERVAGGKELRAKAGVLLDEAAATARSVNGTAGRLDGLADDLRRLLK